MDSIKKHGKVIGIAAGVAAVATGIYLIFKKATKDSHEDRVEISDETGAVIPRADTAALLAGLRINYEGEHLTIQSISQICDATLRFASPKFVELTRRDRKARRAAKNNLKRYIELWEEYAHALEEIIEECQKEILAGLGIQESVWENSNTFYMTQGNHDLLMLHASLPQKLKMSIPPTKTLSKEEFMQVLRAQVALLDKEADGADAIRGEVKGPEELAPIVQNRVNDAIAEEYGVEEEDVFVSMRQYITDPAVQQIFMDLQRATMKLMPMQGGGGYF